MSYADEREYTYTQKCLLIVEYIHQHKRITKREARLLIGADRQTLWRVLQEVERTCRLVRRRHDGLALVEKEKPTV